MTTTEINDLGKKSRGASYDGALKMLRLASHRQLCARVGKPVPDSARVEREVELPGFPLRVDLILHVGPHQLTHIEFETRPGPDLGQRLLYYASRMLRLDKHCRIVQIVVILGPYGDATGTWERTAFAFSTRCSSFAKRTLSGSWPAPTPHRSQPSAALRTKRSALAC